MVILSQNELLDRGSIMLIFVYLLHIFLSKVILFILFAVQQLPNGFKNRFVCRLFHRPDETVICTLLYTNSVCIVLSRVSQQEHTIGELVKERKTDSPILKI